MKLKVDNDINNISDDQYFLIKEAKWLRSEKKRQSWTDWFSLANGVPLHMHAQPQVLFGINGPTMQVAYILTLMLF